MCNQVVGGIENVTMRAVILFQPDDVFDMEFAFEQRHVKLRLEIGDRMRHILLTAEERLLEHRLRAGQVDTRVVESLARKIAAFHAQGCDPLVHVTGVGGGQLQGFVFALHAPLQGLFTWAVGLHKGLDQHHLVFDGLHATNGTHHKMPGWVKWTTGKRLWSTNGRIENRYVHPIAGLRNFF